MMKQSSGFSLVEVLLVVAILSMVAVLMSRSHNNATRVSKQLRAKEYYKDVNEAIINDITARMNAQIRSVAPCMDLATLESNINSFQVVNKSAPSYIFNQNISVGAAAPASHTSAAQRCRTPRRPSNGLNPADNRFYFCLRLGRDAAAPPDSMLNADHAFAELAVEMIDLRSQLRISCTDFRNRFLTAGNGSAGLAVTMILYWEQRRGNLNNFSQKPLSFIFNQKN